MTRIAPPMGALRRQPHAAILVHIGLASPNLAGGFHAYAIFSRLTHSVKFLGREVRWSFEGLAIVCFPSHNFRYANNLR